MKRKVLFFSYHGHLHNAEALRPLIEELGMELICINEKSKPPYDRLTILNEIRKADIVICPCDYKLHPAKSNNKVSQALSCGKPVIASPLQAYLEIEDPNLYIASSHALFSARDNFFLYKNCSINSISFSKNS